MEIKKVTIVFDLNDTEMTWDRQKTENVDFQKNTELTY